MSVMCFKKILCEFQDREVESLVSVRTSFSTVQTLFSQATSVRMTWLFHPDSHQYLEASKCSSFHLSECCSNASGRSLEFQKNPAFKCIRLDDVAIPFGCPSVFDK
jgi:hypothetical protein